MIRRILIVSFTLVICASYAQIYKWTDNQGIVHFSDTPHVGAEKINNLQQNYSPPPSSAIPSLHPKIQPEKENQQGTYTLVAITQPVDQATIRNNQGYIVVTVKLEPQLFPGNKVQILFDDQPRGTPQDLLIFQLNGVYRGSHTIAVQVLGADGEVLKTSPSITIYMQRPRVGMVKRK
jgi:hypothetical protein